MSAYQRAMDRLLAEPVQTVAEQEAERNEKELRRRAKRHVRKHGAAPGGTGAQGVRWEPPGRGKHPMPSRR